MADPTDPIWPQGPEEEERLDRFLETVLWMAWPQRPGFLGVPLELLGTLRNGREARFVKRGDEWWFTAEDEGDEQVVEPSNLARLMVKTDFLPSSVILVPEIGAHVYLASIIETESAYTSWRQSLRAVIDAVPDARRFYKDRAYFDALIMSTDPMGFVMATDAMDACVRHSIAAIPLAIAAADAQVNTWANMWGGWSDSEGRLGLAARYKLLAARAKEELNLDEEPLSSLRNRIRLRNDLIHGNAIAEEQPLKRTAPGKPLIVEARRTCIVVRQALLVLAEIVEAERPKFLAFCPEAPAEDDEVWENARLLTGMRDDSVFPKVGSSNAEQSLP